jgi:hypothetical protein
MIDLSSDPRWMRLTDPQFAAAGFQGGRFEVDVDRPAIWTGGDPVGGDEDFDPNNFLSADFCIISDARFFLHGVSEIAIQGGAGAMLYLGVWAEVSRQSFGAYFRSLDGSSPLPPPMPGAFANQLNGFGQTHGAACMVRARSGAERPLVTLNDARHPLAEAQLRGVTLDRLLDVYAAFGMDLRPALAVRH